MLMGIYCIEDARGFLYYGSSINIKARFRRHKRDLNAGKHINLKLQNAWNKYGENFFSFYVIEVVTDKTKLIEREQVWLDFVFSTEKWCYNISKTANRSWGRKLSKHYREVLAEKNRSPEKRKLLSDVNKGNKNAAGKRTDKQRQRMSDARKQNIKPMRLSDESKQKISIANKGKKRLKEDKDKLALTKSGGKIYTIESPDGVIYTNIININQFAKDMCLDPKGIHKIVSGYRKQYKGFRVVHVDTAANDKDLNNAA